MISIATLCLIRAIRGVYEYDHVEGVLVGFEVCTVPLADTEIT